MSFERALKNEISRFRKMFADCNSPYLSLTIEANGPVDHGDVNIQFRIGESSYGDESVRGNDLDACAAEYFRRKGWKRHNDTLALPYYDENETDND